MKDVIDHFKKELASLRTGRANPNMLDGVMVEVYGSMVPLKNLGNVTTPEARQILIAAYDPATAGPISKAIEKANLGIHPILEGHMVRINVPPLDESMRKKIVEQGKKKAEDAKVSTREVRRKANEQVRKAKADGDITEDEMKKAEKTIQELTDENCKVIDQLFATKQTEILKV